MSWSIGNHTSLHEKLSEALLLNLAQVVKRADDTSHTCFWELTPNKRPQDLSSAIVKLQAWDRWGLPFTSRLCDLLGCLLSAHTSQGNGLTDGDILAFMLIVNLASEQIRSQVLDRAIYALINLPIRRNLNVTTLLIILNTHLHENDSEKFEDLFFRLPDDRFDLFLNVLCQNHRTLALQQCLEQKEELLLNLSVYKISRLIRYVIKIHDSKKKKLAQMLLLWTQESTHFNTEYILDRLPLLDGPSFEPKSSYPMNSNFTCEVAECRLPIDYHVQLTEGYCRTMWELTRNACLEKTLTEFLPELLAVSGSDVISTPRLMIDFLANVRALQTPSLRSIIQFFQSGCILDLISWFVTNAHDLTPAHLDWLEKSLGQIKNTKGQISSIVADVLMFIVDEELSQELNQNKLSISHDAAHADFAGVQALQVHRSYNISRVLNCLCRAELFDLPTLVSLINFLANSSVSLESRSNGHSFTIYQIGELDGFCRWLHCLDVLMEAIVRSHIPTSMRQYYSTNMPDVDESKLNVSGDSYRELREIADIIITSVHSRVLNFSGDPLLIEAALGCLRSALIVHTTQIQSLLSRIRQIWLIVDNVLSSFMIPANSIKVAWSIMKIAQLHAHDFTLATIGPEKSKPLTSGNLEEV